MRTYLRERYNEGSSSEGASLSYTQYWQADSFTEYVKHIAYLPRTGATVYTKDVGWFWLEGTSVSREEPMPNGKIAYNITYNMKTPTAEELPNMGNPPWTYPLSDLSITPSSEEINVTNIYPKNSLKPVPFVNSAGVRMEAAGVKGLTQISFSYNSTRFDINATCGFKSTINAFPVKIAGMEFAARVVLMESYSGNEVIDYDEDGNIKWRYYKISVQMLCHPESWNKKYLNLGTMIRTNGGMEQIWKWTDSSGNVNYGPHSNYIRYVCAGGDDTGEALSEPMFLNDSGTGISWFDGYRQKETYIEGSPFYPADFTFLDLPETRNWRC